VGSWFGKLDLRIVDLDDHSMVLRQDFLKVSQAIPMVDQDILLITVEGRTLLVSMNRRSCLGYRPRIASITLYPKDPNVKHVDVEKRGLRSMTQTMKEGKLVDFISRARRKDEGGKSISHILRNLRGASSTKDLHNGVADEGSLNTSSEAMVGEDYTGKNMTGIMEFCRYAMGIYAFQLMEDKLGKLGCTHEEVEAMHKYLKTHHQSDTWLDESQGGNFLALLS